MENDLETRVAFLEKALFIEAVESLARDCMMRAVIVTHPNLPALRRSFELLIETRGSALSENGFASGRDPSDSMSLNQELTKHAERWLNFFPPA